VLEELGLRQERNESRTQVTGPSRGRSGTAIWGSAERGFDRGVFVVCMYGAS